MKQNTFFAKQNTAVKWIFLLIVVWMLWFAGSAVAGQIRDLFVQSEEVHYVTMEHIEEGYGLVMGTEHLIQAQADGEVTVLIAEGERVRKGNAVFRIGDLYQYTNHAGRVSYQVDNMEIGLDISAVAELDMKQIYHEQQRRKEKKQNAVSGEPYAKVQETMSDIVMYVKLQQNNYTATLETGQSVMVKLLDNDTEVHGTVAEILNTAQGERCVKVEVITISDQLFQQRMYQVALPYNSERVLTIPKQALAKKRGVNGVYYLHKGFVFWKEVTVSERWADQGVLVVDYGLEEGDVIVTTPRLVKEGENIKF